MKTSKMLRFTAMATALSIALVPAKATFLDDFYSSSGTTTNVTPGGVYQGQSSSVIAGGGLSVRVPNRTFNPITFSPPSVSAGCGGIDLYLGAFGFPSGAEMTAFLRNVGQAAGGIAFSIALKALSPELDSTIADFSKRMQSMVSDFKNSCQAATKLVEGVTGKSIAELKKEACEWNRTNLNDDTKCETDSADAAKMKANAVKRAMQDPNAMLNPERNVVWRALNSVDYGANLTDQEKQLIMSMTGSLIFIIDNPNDSAPPRVVKLPPLGGDVENMIDAIKGVRGTTNASPLMYRCSHKATAAPEDNGLMALNNCMITTTANINIGGGFLNKLHTSKDAVISAIRSRTALTASGSLLGHYSDLNAASALPLLKVIQASATNKNSMMSDSLVDAFLEVTATEMTIRYLRFALSALNNGFATASNNALDQEIMKEIHDRRKELVRRLHERETEMKSEITRLNDSLKLYENVQRYMQASLSADLTRSLNLGR